MEFMIKWFLKIQLITGSYIFWCIRIRRNVEVKKAYTSETAKVRPVRGWGALGGGGWGGGRSWRRWTKAPKSALTALFSFLVTIKMPANPNPNNTHKFAGCSAIASSVLRLQSTNYPLQFYSEERFCWVRTGLSFKMHKVKRYLLAPRAVEKYLVEAV